MASTQKGKGDIGQMMSLSADLLVLQPMAQDVVHVLVKPLQAAITRPHIGIVGGHETLHCGL